MSALKKIADRAAEEKLPFLISGGHAVVAHGYPRNTFDLDIIVRQTDSENWKNLARALGYVAHHEGPAFLQFNDSNHKEQPLDIMLANEETFAKMMAEARPTPASTGGAKMVALLHLIALKCHAVKHGHPGRIAKDMGDVIGLLEANRLNPNDPEIRAIFLKYGTIDFYEQIQRIYQKN